MCYGKVRVDGRISPFVGWVVRKLIYQSLSHSFELIIGLRMQIEDTWKPTHLDKEKVERMETLNHLPDFNDTVSGDGLSIQKRIE